MSDVDKFEAQKKKAQEINQKIAALEGAQNEILKQMERLGVSRETLEPTLSALREEADGLKKELADKTAKLDAAISEAEKALND